MFVDRLTTLLSFMGDCVCCLLTALGGIVIPTLPVPERIPHQRRQPVRECLLACDLDRPFFIYPDVSKLLSATSGPVHRPDFFLPGGK